ncbi:MAG: hypothetical protein Q7T58_08650, partial [Methylotenera sp.]|nr:hypothetical protein [Methylotenera sp.]
MHAGAAGWDAHPTSGRYPSSTVVILQRTGCAGIGAQRCRTISQAQGKGHCRRAGVAQGRRKGCVSAFGDRRAAYVEGRTVVIRSAAWWECTAIVNNGGDLGAVANGGVGRAAQLYAEV